MSRIATSLSCAAIALLPLTFSGATHATILEVSGNALKGGPARGMDLDKGGFETDGKVVGFDELQNVTVTADDVTVDFLASDLIIGMQFDGVQNFHFEDGRSLPAGTYDSHTLHFDPVTYGGEVLDATFVFSGPIAAIIVSNSGDAQLQNRTDPAFGSAAHYNLEHTRRCEQAPDINADFFTLLSETVLRVDRMRLVDINTDDVRVLTHSAPVTVDEESWGAIKGRYYDDGEAP